jgi:hypothetical protein
MKVGEPIRQLDKSSVPHEGQSLLPSGDAFTDE